MSEKNRSDPPRPILRLTNMFPESPASPFHGTRSISSMGQLRVHRFHPKPEEDGSACSPEAAAASSTSQHSNNGHHWNTTEMETICRTTSWSAWSPCSITCGTGTRGRTRTFVDPDSESDCDFMPTSDREDCPTGVECPEHCELTNWSAWSACRGTNGEPCQIGFETTTGCTQHRDRMYVKSGDDFS